LLSFDRRPSESWKRFSTAEWLVIHLDLDLALFFALGPSKKRFARCASHFSLNGKEK
jgi:hypothetical protein